MLTGPIELTQRIATCAYRFSEQLITGRLMYMRRKYFSLPLAINLCHNGEKKVNNVPKMIITVFFLIKPGRLRVKSLESMHR